MVLNSSTASWAASGSGSGTNDLSLRLSVERLLGAADLHPHGLPPSAVLVVRQMEDPLPGGLASSPGDLRPRLEWERQARQQLAELARRAARPLALARLGASPAGAPGSAEAVFFADGSELLACLAMEVGRGQAQERWWWQAVIRAETGRGPRLALTRTEVAIALARFMERQGHLVPGTLALLHTLGEATRAVLSLSPVQGRRVLEAMLAAYGLPSLAGEEGGFSGFPPLAEAADLQRGMGPIRPPWKQQVSALGPEREALLGWGLDLHHRPPEARSPNYRRQVLNWWNRQAATGVGKQATRSPVEADETLEGHGPTPALQGSHIQPPRATGSDNLREAGDQAAGGRPTSPSPESHLYQTPTTGSDDVREAGARKGAGRPPSPSPESLLHGNLVSGSPNLKEASEPALPVSAGEAPAASGLSPYASGSRVDTGIGGCLYLINLMTSLDLPDAFEEGWRLASGVGAWGLLEALSRALLEPGHEADPLWPALAALDNRPAGLSLGFRLPKSRPRRWPASQAPAGWEGFYSYSSPGHKPRKRTGEGTTYPPLLERWLRLALPFIERRLWLALSPGNENEMQASLIRDLLHLQAKVHISTSHVDLVASIEDIWLPTRRAGLDRDPGWRPEFGRVITFHFE